MFLLDADLFSLDVRGHLGSDWVESINSVLTFDFQDKLTRHRWRNRSIIIMMIEIDGSFAAEVSLM